LTDHDNKPNTENDEAATNLETDVVVDLLSNDSDLDGDELIIDGLIQPLNGRVFDNGDGTITYRPDLEFSGVDVVKYWATDGFGNYEPGFAEISVSELAFHELDYL